MGLSLAEYEESVGDLNKRYHEQAESLILHKEGVLPLRRDEDDQPDVDTGKKKARHQVR